MGKASSNIAGFIGRLVKCIIAALAMPFAVGLFLAFFRQLEASAVGGVTAQQWVKWGAWTYLVIHLLLYRPAPVFEVSHRIFSTIAVWLFGSQVASVDDAKGSSAASSGKKVKESKGKTSAGRAAKDQGSTLVAFSPFVIPLYAVIVCLAGWLLSRWIDHAYLDAPVAFLVGFTIMLHWIMTADALQEQRSQWHLETYLLAIALVFILTLLIGGACLPLAFPDVSYVQALGEGASRAQETYQTVIKHLFF